VRWCRNVGRRNRPAAFDVNRLETCRNGRQNLLRLVRRLMERRAVHPDDVLVVMIDFNVQLETVSIGPLIEVAVGFDVVRREVAVRDRRLMVVPRFWLVDVLRR
jgi:hypothetical protein